MINTKHFVLLAGNPQKWDDETKQQVSCGVNICRVQEDQHARGFRSATIVKSIYGYGVRSTSGLDGFSILASTKDSPKRGVLDGTIEDAVRWGKEWVAQDPDNRELIARIAEVKESQSIALIQEYKLGD